MDSFFGIGMFELVMIAIIALVVLGPERLPSAMREVAKYMKQLRQISNDFQSQFSDELKVLDEINPRRLLNEALDPNARPVPPAVQPPRQPRSIRAGAASVSMLRQECLRHRYRMRNQTNTILPPSQPPPPVACGVALSEAQRRPR